MKEVKPKRMSRRNLINSFLDNLSKRANVTILDIKYKSDYFVFNYGKDSICHFRIKELPDFLFAVWKGSNVNLDYYGADFKDAELLFFTQPILTIDKFKPSRSSFLVPSSRRMYLPNNSEEWKEEWEDYSAVQMIDYMLNHKYRAFFKSSCSYWDPWQHVSGFTAFKEYYGTKFYYWKKDKKTKRNIRKITKVISKILNRLNVKAILSDFGDGYYPRLHLYFHENTIASKEESDLITNAYNYLEDKFFDKLTIIEIKESSKFKQMLKRRIAFNNSEKCEEVILWKKI